MVEVGAFEVVRVEPSVQRTVLLLVVEEVEERSPRLAPARAPAHLHHVALCAVGDRDVEVLDALRDAGMPHVARAPLDAVEPQAVDAVVEAAVQAGVAAREGREAGEEGLPGEAVGGGATPLPRPLGQPRVEMHAERKDSLAGSGNGERHRYPEPAAPAGGGRPGDAAGVFDVLGPPFRERRRGPVGLRTALRGENPAPGGGVGPADLHADRQLLPGPIGEASNPAHAPGGGLYPGHRPRRLGREHDHEAVGRSRRERPGTLQDAAGEDLSGLDRRRAVRGPPLGHQRARAPAESGRSRRKRNLRARTVQQGYRKTRTRLVLQQMGGVPESGPVQPTGKRRRPEHPVESPQVPLVGPGEGFDAAQVSTLVRGSP